MLRLDENQQEQLRQAVAEAGRARGVTEAVTSIYADLQQAINTRQPRCDRSGRCCNFEAFGHKLFVTTAELAVFRQITNRLQAINEHPLDPASSPPASSSLHPSSVAPACPFQLEGLCSVHTARPFGCRIFFCDPTAEQWQQEQYEHFHARLKSLHEALGLTYFYVEWREALKALGWTAVPSATGRVGLPILHPASAKSVDAPAVSTRLV